MGDRPVPLVGPESWQKVTYDTQTQPRRPIATPHVYSIGSNGNVMFEAGVKDQISKDCEIHTFDPGASNRRFGDFAEALKPYSTFHQWALGTDEEAKTTKNIKSLDMTVTELGHEGRRIDIFKIDCELCEWTTFGDWLKCDVRQHS